MKNWLPLVAGPEFAMESKPRSVCLGLGKGIILAALL
jgi:hypothetical protein